MPSCLVFSHFLSVCSFYREPRLQRELADLEKKTSLKSGYSRLLSTNFFFLLQMD